MAYIRPDGLIETNDGRIINPCEPLTISDYAQIAPCIVPGICKPPFGRGGPGRPGAPGPGGPKGGSCVHYRFSTFNFSIGIGAENEFTKSVTLSKPGVALLGQVDLTNMKDSHLELDVDGTRLFGAPFSFIKDSRIVAGGGTIPLQMTLHIVAADSISAGAHTIKLITVNDSGAGSITVRHRALMVLEGDIDQFDLTG